MTRHWDDLAHPPVAGLSEQERASLAELHTVAIAARERAGVLYDACEGKAALAITELTQLADRIQARAITYENGG